MASEDSVENVLHWALALFAVEVHRVRELNDLRKAGGLPVGLLCEQPQDVPEASEVVPTRGEPHVPPQERCDDRGEDRTGVDRVDQHRFVPRLGVDRADTEFLPGHFEERPPHSMLSDAESRLDEEAKRHRRVGLDAHVDAALALNHSSEKPAALLLARQAFLLIACTGRIVTHSPNLPRRQDGREGTARYSGVPAYSQILQPPKWLTVIVTAAVYRGLVSELCRPKTANPST